MNNAPVFVVTAGVDIGATLAPGLAARGASVAWFGDGDVPPGPGPGLARRSIRLASRADLEHAFADAAAQLGRPSQVVISVLPPAALQAQDISAVSGAQWQAACSAAMKGVLYGLQASFTQMGEGGGSVVVIGPSLSLPGAAQLVALTTAVEGQRGLVKSTARQWGRRGLTVNWLALAPRGLSSRFDGLPLPVKPDAVMVALGRPLDLASEVVPVIEFLGSPQGRVMTGVTLMLDGGEWMVP